MHRFKLFLSLIALALMACGLSACKTANEEMPSLAEMEQLDAAALNKRGENSLKAGKYEIASKAFKAALAQDETNSKARLGLADSYVKLGREVEALEEYRHLITIPEYAPRAFQGIGLAELQRGNLEPAGEALGLAVEGDETLWRAWNGLGQVSDYEGDWEASKLAYENALSYTPDKHVIYNNMGVSYMAQQRFKEAEKAFVQALRYEPDLESAQTNHKLALAMQDKYDEATLEGNEHERAKALNNAGYAAMLQGRYGDAEKMFIKAIEVSPSFYKAAYSNLQVLHKLKQNKK